SRRPPGACRRRRLRSWTALLAQKRGWLVETSAQAKLKILGRRFCSMSKFVFEMNQSLDGYVDHLKLGPPHPALFGHFIERVRGLTGMLYGRRLYEIMRYWDD